MKNSLKQLFRRPGRALLFFLLMTAATMLMVFGAAMYIQNELRVQALEGIYTTVGTVNQEREDFESMYPTEEDYGEGGIIRPEELLFEGADYILPPESRPYMLAYLEDAWVSTGTNWNAGINENSHLLEIKILGPGDQAQTMDPYTGQVAYKTDTTRAQITKVIVSSGVTEQEEFAGTADSWGSTIFSNRELEEGQEIYVTNEWPEADPLETGKTYVGCLQYVNSFYTVEVTAEGEETAHPIPLFIPSRSPGCTLVDRQGKPLSTSLNNVHNAYQEVTPGFYDEDGPITGWMELTKEQEMYQKMFPVLPVSDPDLLTFHRLNIAKIRGRMITDEEFESGARVCLVSKDFAQKNLLYEGDKITLPLVASMYGYEPNSGWGEKNYTFPAEICRLMDRDGRALTPFWEAEYEIVGIFEPRYRTQDLPFGNMFIIPQKSIEGSDENAIIYNGAMHSQSTSFMIPNGSIETFDAALRAAVPQVERLDIQYNDMGYARAVESLNDAKQTAMLLFAVGMLAAVAIIALLLYFFIVVEKKRTAVERSLGMTRSQCRVSLMAGVMVLTLAATLLGGVGAGVLLEKVDAYTQAQAIAETAAIEESSVVNWSLGGIYNFSAKYSPWAMWDVQGNQTALNSIVPPNWIYAAAPLALSVFVLLLGLILINRSLKIEPLLLLNAK
ncbi:ABC transporter permease [Acutalibacter caecimuris]|uniref:ABC transporter permease n=1 Tax=Acutalibacter caecimuris TaxID=3093657 RepID=UPI002AC91A53|nr:FtsX-like permease family protein [Acutalibacter sp. M00118]